MTAPRVRHVAIIRAKPGSDLPPRDIKDEFARAVKPSSDKICIKGMREAKDSLAVKLGSEEDFKRLENLERVKRALIVERPRKKLPKLIIYEVPNSVKKEDIERYAQLNAPIIVYEKGSTPFRHTPAGGAPPPDLSLLLARL